VIKPILRQKLHLKVKLNLIFIQLLLEWRETSIKESTQKTQYRFQSLNI
jgi:hypothetical protein